MTTQKCIWMECGYVEYKLCDRNFDCENCPFDIAIKKERDNIEIVNQKETTNFISRKIITSNHIWFYKEGNTYTFGLDHFVQKFFDHKCTLSFPIFGSKLFEGKTFLWVIGSFGAIGFHSPITGTVVWINEEIKDNSIRFFETNSLNIDLIKVESSQEIKTINLFTIENLDDLIKIDNSLIKEFLIKKFSASRKFLTLPDGGDLIKDYLNRLSNQDYLQLLKMLFNKK